MNFFLTGHRGFLGKAVRLGLIAHGHEVRFVDTRLTSQSVARLNLEDTDRFIHLAASTPQGKRLNASDFEADVALTSAIATRCCDQNIRLVYASSSAVYQSNRLALNEDSVLSATGPYAESKFACEQSLCKKYDDDQLDCVILRLFNPYGPTLRDDYFLPYVLRSAIERKVIDVRCPENIRDYIHMRDIVFLIQNATTVDLGEFRATGLAPIFNIGSGVGYSGSQIINLMQQYFADEVLVKYPASAPPGDCFVADIDRAKRYLGFDVQTSLESGIQQLIRVMTDSKDGEVRS